MATASRIEGMPAHGRPNFEQCAISSGLLTQEQFEAARLSVRWSQGDEADPGAPPSEKQLAEQLVERGLLNAWQAKQLLDGRTKFNLGRYWIVDSLGQGGMGQVFKARDSQNDRIVAVKVLPRYKSTPEAIASFAREIRSLACLNHVKLVAALDAGHDGNVYYLVTEYVSGIDLRKLVRRHGPLGMSSAANIIFQVAEGLTHAHAQGMIHRDVKPGNVLVTPEGETKLSDLGLAGPLESSAEKDPQYGKIAGTADYLSPDQVKCPWNPTPAWDIYALGCTLYYAVTGKVPFPGGGTRDKARAHCELRPLDPRRLNPRLTAEFVDMMADMMAKDPEQRIPSAEAVMERLRPWLPGGPLAETSPKQPGAMAPGISPPAPPVVLPPRVSRPIPPSRTPVAAGRHPREAENWEDTKSDFPELPRAADSSESSSIAMLPDIESAADDESSSLEMQIPLANDEHPSHRSLGWFALIPLGILSALLLIWLLYLLL